MSVNDEYRRLVEAAGLEAAALPSDRFFGPGAEAELARALREQEFAREAERAEYEERFVHNNALATARAAAYAAGEQVEPLRIGVLISGSGTNLQALIDSIAAGALHARIELVVASRPHAAGLARAEAAGIQTLSLSKEIYQDPIAADEVIAAELLRRGVEYVLMAGYMRRVHAPLLATFPNRVVNLHPALLPSFPGAHAICDAYARGVKVTGVTVHFANAAYDAGPIIAQRALVVEEGWSIEQLEAQIHKIEHELYPQVVALLDEGRVLVREDLTVEVRSNI